MNPAAQKIWQLADDYLLTAKEHLVWKRVKPPLVPLSSNHMDFEDEALRLIFLFPLHQESWRQILLDIRFRRLVFNVAITIENESKSNLAMSERDKTEAAFVEACKEVKMTLATFSEVQQEILLTHYLPPAIDEPKPD